VYAVCGAGPAAWAGSGQVGWEISASCLVSQVRLSSRAAGRAAYEAVMQGGGRSASCIFV